jgi:hypothetical protein
VDEQVGVLFDESGSLISWNQTARTTRLLRFTTWDRPVDGYDDMFLPSPYDWIFYGSTLLCIGVYCLGRWAHRRWRRTHVPKRC